MDRSSACNIYRHLLQITVCMYTYKYIKIELATYCTVAPPCHPSFATVQSTSMACKNFGLCLVTVGSCSTAPTRRHGIFIYNLRRNNDGFWLYMQLQGNSISSIFLFTIIMLSYTLFVLNYCRSFHLKFDSSSYLKKSVQNIVFFFVVTCIIGKIFKNNLNSTMFIQFFYKTGDQI